MNTIARAASASSPNHSVLKLALEWVLNWALKCALTPALCGRWQNLPNQPNQPNKPT